MNIESLKTLFSRDADIYDLGTHVAVRDEEVNYFVEKSDIEDSYTSYRDFYHSVTMLTGYEVPRQILEAGHKQVFEGTGVAVSPSHFDWFVW